MLKRSRSRGEMKAKSLRPGMHSHLARYSPANAGSLQSLVQALSTHPKSVPSDTCPPRQTADIQQQVEEAFGSLVDALRPEHSVLRALLDALPVGVWIVDGSGHILYGNLAGQAIWGGAQLVDTEHFGRYRAWWSATGRPVTAEQWAAARAVTRGETVLDQQVEVESFDGTRKTILNSAVPVLDHGRILGAVVLNQDITDRRLAQAEHERLRAALDQAGEIVFTTRPDGTIEYVNAAFEAVTGYAREEVIGQTPAILESRKQRPEFFADLWQTINGGQTWRGRMTNRRKDGTHFIQDATICPILDASGHVVNFVAVARDVTEHLQMAERLVTSQKMEAVGTLAGGVAHDFNNLLSVILGYTRLASAQLSDADPIREDLAEIARAGERAAVLTRQLLAFSRKQVLEPRVLQCSEVIEGLASMLRRLIGENIKFELRMSPDTANVLADPGQLEQALMNLVVNARDAMPNGGTLEISTGNIELDEEYCLEHAGTAPGDYVRVSVADSGCGMDAPTLERVFEPFFTTKPKDKGTGLGLSTVYGIIKQSGGSISLDSQLGVGTVVSVFLPRQTANAAPYVAKGKEVHHLRGSETILVVEDEGAVRRSTVRLLRSAGYTVLEAANGHEAIQICGTHPGTIHLLLTDVIMPKMTGVELATILSQAHSGLRVLFMSGYPDDAIGSSGALGEATHFLNKPFGVQELELKVRQVLEGASAETPRPISVPNA